MATVKRIFLSFFAIVFLLAGAAAAGNAERNASIFAIGTGVFEETSEAETENQESATAEETTLPSQELPPASQSTTAVSENTRRSESEVHFTGFVRYAANAILYDYTNDVVLYHKNVNTIIFPASTTKLLTSCVCLKYLSPDDVLTVGSEINMIAADSSVAGLKEGYELTVSDLIYCMMVPSGNDAAYTVAVNTARRVSGNDGMTDGEAIQYFASLMNDYARELGATSSNFRNPDGYHDFRHYTTVSDLLLIAKKAVSIPLIRTAGSCPQRTLTISSGQKLVLRNTNELLQMTSDYYYPYCTGLKTGYTTNAGCCLVATASRSGKMFIAIVMGCNTPIRRFVDATNLFEAAFSEE